MKFFYSLLFCSFIFLACQNNESEIDKSTCIIDDIEFSYFLKDTAGVARNTFSKGEILVIGLSVKNKRNDTIMVNSQYLGACYDKNNQWVQEMSNYEHPDTLPTYTTILSGDTRSFTYAFFVDAPSDSSTLIALNRWYD